MTERWLPIRHYRDFYDIPRAFVVEHANEQLLFECPFSEALDDYGDGYTIYRISDELRERIDLISWRDLGNQLERIAVVPTTAVTFDATNRRAISAEVVRTIRATEDERLTRSGERVIVASRMSNEKLVAGSRQLPS